ncbi:kinase-like domain-containing protein [Chytridium lagenaria]|nr:kinase-like domain-containing protein [Chytridium lagenaria]
MTMYWKRKDVTAKMETAGLKDGDVTPQPTATHPPSLGKGGCGDVYLAQTLSPHHPPTLVAIKTIKRPPQYHNELHVLRLLNHHKLGRVADTVEQRRVIVMEYLGETLAMKFEQLGYCFSLKTIAMIAINMLHLSHDFYLKNGHVHVDLKPSNICVGPTGRELHVIDFGYATLPSVKLPGQTGTPLFMAVQVQSLGAVYPSWLDDLESIAYCRATANPVSPGDTSTPTPKSLKPNPPPHPPLSPHPPSHPASPSLATPLTRLLDVARNRQRTVGNASLRRWSMGLWVVRELGGNDGMYDWV